MSTFSFLKENRWAKVAAITLRDLRTGTRTLAWITQREAMDVPGESDENFPIWAPLLDFITWNVRNFEPARTTITVEIDVADPEVRQVISSQLAYLASLGFRIREAEEVGPAPSRTMPASPSWDSFERRAIAAAASVLTVLMLVDIVLVKLTGFFGGRGWLSG
jgi:hypothetical protein